MELSYSAVPERPTRKRASKEITDRVPEPHEYGFCCSTCKCPEEEKRTDAIQSSEDSLWHRYCCHKITSFNVNWKSPIDRAQEEALKKCEKAAGDEQDAGFMICSPEES